MSTGMVICSACKRELHQDGDKAIQNGWIHCPDKTAMCIGAHAEYPKSPSDIKGPWCGRDDEPRKRDLFVQELEGFRLSQSVCGRLIQKPAWLRRLETRL